MKLPLRAGPARLLLCLAAWLAVTLWVRPLALPDEGRYVGVAWEMLRSGNWRVPTLDGLPFFHKPPLFYWITAVSLKLFGVHTWSARLAPLIGALLACGSVYLLLRRRADEATAQATLLALGSLPFLVGASQYANLDMLVAGCITATVCAGADAALAAERGEPQRRSVLLAWLFCALGVLSKGLIGLVLPGATLLIWIVLRRQWRALAALLWWPAILLALAVGGPWFVLMEQAYPDFLHYFFVYQQFQRFAETGFNNVQPFWFYPAAIALLALPWSAGLWWLARRRTPVGAPGGGLTLLMAVWWLVVVGFFSIPKSKLIGYVLPSLPPLAALLAAAWRARFGDARVALLAALSAALSLAAMVGVAVYDRKSAAPLVPAIEAQRRAGEPLIFVGRYVYDLPLLLREPAPVPVVTDWHDQAALHRDSWEKELADAAQFDPATASGVLVDQSALQAALCHAPVTWVVVNDRPVPPELAGAQVLARTRYLTLLRLDLTPPAARAAACGERPTSG